MSEKEVHVAYGSEVRSIGDGLWEGHLVLFHDKKKDEPDLYKTYFLPDGNYGRAKHSPVFYAHGKDPVIGKREFTNLADIGQDQWGWWIRHQINMRKSYELAVDALAQVRAVGFSSGVPAHLIIEEPNEDGTADIRQWLLGTDASYVINPGDPRQEIVPVRDFTTRNLQDLLIESGLRREATMLEHEDVPRSYAVTADITNNRGIEMPEKEAATVENTAPAQETPKPTETATEKPAENVREAPVTPVIHGTAENYKRMFDEIQNTVQKLQKEVDDVKATPANRSFTLPDGTVAIDPEDPLKDDYVLPNSFMDKPEYYRAWRSYIRRADGDLGVLRNARATLQVNDDVGGGYLVPPPLYVKKLLKNVDDMVAMRGAATKFQLGTAQSMGCPTLDNSGSDPDKCIELYFGDEDTDMAFGGRELTPHDFAKYVKISKKLVRVVPNVESLVRERMAYKFSTVMENKYCNGSLNNEPLGVFTESDLGISDSQDFDCASGSVTDWSADDLIDFVHTLKMQYWGAAKILVHRNFMNITRKIVGSVGGEYLWPAYGTGLEKNIVFQLLGFPLIISDYAPSTYNGAGDDVYAAIIGDFSFYWIADGLNMSIEVLKELGAATNQNYYVGRLESDGMPVLEEAFVRMKLAAT